MKRDFDDSDFPSEAGLQDQLRFLVRYAAMAPSSHNSQPWYFLADDGGFRVRIERDRWLEIADADKRELHVSVGCALENLLIAAEHFGFGHEVTYFPNGEEAPEAADVRLTANGDGPTSERLGLFEAIRRRHTSREVYEERPLEAGVVEQMENVIFETEVDLVVLQDEGARLRIDQLIALADARQFADPEWRRELGSWIGRGAFGNSWLMAKLGQLAVTHLNMADSTAREDVELLDSAPIFASLVTNDDSPTTRVRTGQAFERLWLQATVLRVCLHPMNQILQLPDIKSQFRELLPVSDHHPQVAFRMGHCDREVNRRSPRRPLDEVLREPASDD